MKSTALLALLLILAWRGQPAVAQGEGEPAPSSPAPVLVLCFHDLGRGVPDLPATVRLLRRVDADVLVLAGIRDEAALRFLRDGLGANFADWVRGADPEHRLAMLAKSAPAAFTAHETVTYRIKDCDLPVRRGFLQALVVVGDYRLHVFAAHLKSREKHDEFNQTDMRRYEGRRLRALVNDLLAREPQANILVLGNFNDTCGMSTVKEIYNRRFGIHKRLFDLRPTDGLRTSWTSWDPAGDAYERIIYALATAALIPEMVRDGTRILHDPAWEAGSVHRPLVVTIACRDQPEWPKERLDAIFPNTIYAVDAASDEEKEREIGVNRQRASPGAGVGGE
jgi:endonuclease/exonuclease/phosphatase family metal-dependent hydrolase